MRCQDCHVEPGQFHISGCDAEICPRCGGQIISCSCVYLVNGLDLEIVEFTHPEVWINGPTDEMYHTFDELYPNRIKYNPVPNSGYTG